MVPEVDLVDNDLRNHRNNRDSFYQAIPHFWANLYGMEYALYDIKKVPLNFIEKLKEASECVSRIFWKTNRLLSQLDTKVLHQLGFPSEIVPFISSVDMNESCVIGRLDFAVNEGQIKLLEFNSDTPTFIKETFHINHRVCKHFDCKDPNQGEEEKLRKAIRSAVSNAWRRLGKETPPKIVFTSHGGHEEDHWTSKYLMELYELPSEFVALEDLSVLQHPIIQNGTLIQEEGVYTPRGEKIDILYRQTYPLEHLIEDRDPHSDTPVGEILLRFVQQKKIAIINPVSAFLMQSKAVQALIWGLHEEKNSFFTEREHQWIEEYFLPTYLDPDPFLEKQTAFVKKPSFGREGDTVEIWNQQGEKWMEDENKTYSDSLPIYQKFIPLENQKIRTIEGEKKAKVMYGCFLLDGIPSSIGVRAGGQITDNASYYLPICIDEGMEEDQ